MNTFNLSNTTPLMAAIGLAVSLSVNAADAPVVPSDNGKPMLAAPKAANESPGPVGGTPTGSSSREMKDRKPGTGMNSTQDTTSKGSSNSPKSANETAGPK